MGMCTWCPAQWWGAPKGDGRERGVRCGPGRGGAHLPLDGHQAEVREDLPRRLFAETMGQAVRP